MLEQSVSQDVLKATAVVIYLPFNKPLISPSFAESSSFLKSLVFCAKSFRCTVESRWY
jgi:hypothetical protein